MNYPKTAVVCLTFRYASYLDRSPYQIREGVNGAAELVYAEALSQQCRTSTDWTRNYAGVDKTLVLVSKIVNDSSLIVSADPQPDERKSGDNEVSRFRATIPRSDTNVSTYTIVQ